jgi:N,N'-diacetyllegionaminate synthase
MKKQKRVFILGAGPIGLVSGWKLAEKDWDVNLFERNNTVGGMCRSFKWHDFIVDIGPHIFHTPDQVLKDFWLKEFGGLFQEGKFYCKNIKGEKFETSYDYPLSWESITTFPKELKEKIISETEDLSPYKKARAKTYREYMDAQVGPTLREMFFEKYPKKIWGIDTETLTADWAPKRIKFRAKIAPFYENEWAAVGKKGVGSIYENIAEKIVSNGGKINLGSTVIGFETSNKLITKIKFADGSEKNVDEEDVIISSLPLTITSRFLGHQSDLKFRGVRIAFVALNKKMVLPEGIHWQYYDSEKVIFNRVTEAKSMSPSVAPIDKTYLTVEVTYSHGDEIDLMSDESFLARILKDLETVNLAKNGDVFDTLSIKEPYVYPIQFKGYQDQLVKTRAVLNQYSQLYSLGTGGDFNYADSQILFHMAFDTVNNLTHKDSHFAQTIREVVPVKQNEVVKIREKIVGQGHRAYIIAEAGMNHNGSVELGYKLIDEAISTGCDAIKFQSFQKGNRVSSKMKGAHYAEIADGLQENIHEMFDRLSMSFEDQTKIFKYAKEKGIEVFSTPFDFESVDFLEEMDVNLYKIASMDIVNLPLIRYVAKKGKPIILSTGMSTLASIDEAVDTILKEGNPNIILLHCNSSYPAAENEMNLNVINSLKHAFKVPVGLSDHTIGPFVTQVALAIGANMIERHFTLSRTMEGPDHILSSEPDEMAKIVDTANRIPTILGSGIKKIQPNEYATLNAQRRSLYAACDIEEGTVISADMIIIKGPGGGILPKYLDLIVSRTARVRIEADTPITWQNV